MDKVKERACYCREALDKPLVEVDEPKDACLVLQDWPFADSSHLDRVHRDFVF